MRIAHADRVHVVEGIADVVDAVPAHADALRDEPRSAVQVELAHVGRMGRVGDEGQRAHRPVFQPHRNQPGLIDAAGHLAVPQPGERAAQACRVDAVGHAPA